MHRWLAGLAWLLVASWGVAADAPFDDLVSALATNDAAERAQAAVSLVTAPDPRSTTVLDALLAGKLYRRTADNRVVIADRDGRRYTLEDAATGEALPDEGRRGVRRIPADNALRTRIRTARAMAELQAPDPERRRAAAFAALEAPDEATLQLLRTTLRDERDRTVLHALDVAIAVVTLELGPAEAKVSATERLAGVVHPAAQGALERLVNDPGTPDSLKQKARRSMAKTRDKVVFFGAVETVFFGLSLGSVLVLAAVGLAITFGVMGVINMAHGELIMLGAYTTYVLQGVFAEHLGFALLLAIPVAFLVSGLTGVAIERGVIRHLYGRPLETLLATFGISLILQQTVRTVFSPLNRTVETPQWMAGAWQITEGLALTTSRLYIILFAGLIFAGLLVLLNRTRMGLQIRAVAQNRAMARSLGIRSSRVDAITFGLGAGVAGVAGVALSQLTNVGPNMGQAYIIDSFLVVVFGGVGNLWGTLIAGLSLGAMSKVLEPAAGAVLAKVLLLVAVILFIQRYPRGLFPQRGRAVD